MEYISRSQKKRAAESLQALGEKLMKLSSQQIEALELPEELAEAVAFAKTLTQHGAYRRQMQRIGTLMREIDPEPIVRALSVIEQGDYKKSQAFHQVEQWRDDLVAGNDALLEEIAVRYRDVDRQKLTQLVRNARKEKQQEKTKKSARNLFAYLRQIQEAGQHEAS